MQLIILYIRNSFCLYGDPFYMLLNHLFIKIIQTKKFAKGSFKPFLRNSWCSSTNPLSMFHTVGTAPDNLPGRSGDSAVVGAALFTNYKAAQYVLRTVPGGLSFACVFVYITAFALFSLHHEEVCKINNVADVLLIGEHVIDYWTGPPLFSLRGGDTLLKKKISDTFKAVTLQISLIDLLYYVCLLWFDENADGFLHKSIRDISHDWPSFLLNGTHRYLIIKMATKHEHQCV